MSRRGEWGTDREVNGARDWWRMDGEIVRKSEKHNEGWIKKERKGGVKRGRERQELVERRNERRMCGGR